MKNAANDAKKSFKLSTVPSKIQHVVAEKSQENGVNISLGTVDKCTNQSLPLEFHKKT
jgi:hypothetical protein